jgi:hypothetical protein
VFEAVGLFDAGARANEDAELNQRIIEAGLGVYLSREVVSFYFPRASLRALFAQYYAYGQGRARTLLRRRRLLSPRPLVPFATVTSFAVMGILALAVPGARPLLLAAALAYAALVVAESARVARRASASREVLPLLPLIFPTMHAAHGLGVWAGLARNAGRGIARATPERLLARS